MNSTGESARSKAPTVAVAAVGCKVNREEVECLLSRLGGAGFRVVPFGQPADWVVVNTCAVTSQADAESRRVIRKAIRAKEAGRLVITGCLAQLEPEAVRSLDGIDWVLGNAEKPDLAARILGAAETPPLDVGSNGGLPGVEVRADPTLPRFPAFGSGRGGRRVRATLKVQDGCDSRCAYCVVPLLRGASRSRPLADCLAQARLLIASGYAEIALTGIHTTLWGRDLPGGLRLPDLLEALDALPGLVRLRLNSLEPNLETLTWLDRIKGCVRLAPHFHLPLQSADDALLLRMRRPYTAATYAEIIQGIRARWPAAAIGCDVLAGFPGETVEQFERTLRFVRALALSYLHVFTWSPRAGTAATELSGRIPPSTARARSTRLRAAGCLLKDRFARTQLGTTQDVLVESSCGPDLWQGLTGNYLRVRFPLVAAARPARPLQVRLTALAPDRMLEGIQVSAETAAPDSVEAPGALGTAGAAA